MQETHNRNTTLLISAALCVLLRSNIAVIWPFVNALSKALVVWTIRDGVCAESKAMYGTTSYKVR